MPRRIKYADKMNTPFSELKPPAVGEDRRELERFWPGGQCPHLTNVWFTDPRPQDTPKRSNKIVFREFLANRMPDSSVVKAARSRFLSRNDEDADSAEEKAFPLFPLLPAELQCRIWEASLPSRVVDLAGHRYGNTSFGYGNTDFTSNYPLPVPQLASVCRGAREAVLRAGTQVMLESKGNTNNRSTPDDHSCFMRPLGFVLHNDVPVFVENLRRPPGIERRVRKGNIGLDVCDWTTETIVDGLSNAGVMMVRWYTPSSTLTGPRREGDRYFQRKVTDWSFLKSCKSLHTLLVEFRPQIYLDLRFRRQEDSHDGIDVSDNCLEEVGTVELLAELHDDARLAEITALETVPHRLAIPRYRSQDANAGMSRCLNCERVKWENQHKHVVERFWLQLWAADELSCEEQSAVFPSRESYDAEHPWAKEKLRTAPEFKPVVLFQLGARLGEDQTTDEASSEAESSGEKSTQEHPGDEDYDDEH